MRYNLFIGRYQSPHKGHMQIFNTFLEEGKPILIAIRDIEPDNLAASIFTSGFSGGK